MPTFDVTHTADGLAALVEKLSTLDGEVRIVMEHTGRYYESIAAALHNAGSYVSAVNPLLIKEYGGNTLRKVKTDKADAKKIVRYALDNTATISARERPPRSTGKPRPCSRWSPSPTWLG